MKQITSQTALDEIHITLAMLENMPSGARACSAARHWFQKNFPNGGELAEVWDACPSWRWQVWFAVHSATTEEAVAFAQSCAERVAIYAVAAVAKAADAAAATYVARAAAYAAAYVYAAVEAAASAYAAAYAARVRAYAYAAHAAYAAARADAHVDEIQAQVAWARGILFS